LKACQRGGGGGPINFAGGKTNDGGTISASGCSRWNEKQVVAASKIGEIARTLRGLEKKKKKATIEYGGSLNKIRELIMSTRAKKKSRVHLQKQKRTEKRGQRLLKQFEKPGGEKTTLGSGGHGNKKSSMNTIYKKKKGRGATIPYSRERKSHKQRRHKSMNTTFIKTKIKKGKGMTQPVVQTKGGNAGGSSQLLREDAQMGWGKVSLGGKVKSPGRLLSDVKVHYMEKGPNQPVLKVT